LKSELITKPEEYQVLRELESIIGRKIPYVNEIRYNTFGVKTKSGNVIGLGLSGAVSFQEQKSIEREKGLTELQNLGVYSNRTRLTPEFFNILRSPQERGLRKKQLTVLPNSIGDLRSLQTLNLAFNKIETLPESFGQLKSLQNLNLAFNKLQALPESFGQLKVLQELNLIHNQLKYLPKSFVDLESLQNLNLFHNQIIKLPKSFGKLKSLQILKLTENQLNTLPESFGQLKALQELNLTHNKLNRLPGSFWGLQHLKTLKLEENPWEGEWKEMTLRSIPALLEFCRKLDCIHIFISYAIIDYESRVYPIADLANNLTARDEIYHTFHCMQDMKRDGQIDKFMNETIPECQIVLFIATKNSLQSRDCQHELDLARAHDIKIIPILGEDLDWDEIDLIKSGLENELRLQFRNYGLIELGDKIYNYVIQFKKEKVELKEFKLKIKDVIKNYMNSTEFQAGVEKNLLQFKELFKKLSENQISPLEYYLGTTEIFSKISKIDLNF